MTTNNSPKIESKEIRLNGRRCIVLKGEDGLAKVVQRSMHEESIIHFPFRAVPNTLIIRAPLNPDEYPTLIYMGENMAGIPDYSTTDMVVPNFSTRRSKDRGDLAKLLRAEYELYDSELKKYGL